MIFFQLTILINNHKYTVNYLFSQKKKKKNAQSLERVPSF